MALGHPHRGMCVGHLSTTLLHEVESAGLSPSATIIEIEPVVIRARGQGIVCPRDGRRGAAYIDCLQCNVEAGLAQYLLSYTWRYSIGQIAHTLTTFFEMNATPVKQAYVWICFACVNQHRVQEKMQAGEVVSFDQFSEVFGGMVRSIGTIICMMSPWHSPTALKRVWCIFEIFTALQENCKFEVAIPPQELLSFKEALLVGDGLDRVWSVLSNVNVQEAEASVQADKRQLLKLIEANAGFHAVNIAITQRLQQWCLESAGLLLSEATPEQHVKLAANIGCLYMRLGRYVESIKFFNDGVRCLNLSPTPDLKEGINLFMNLGIAKSYLGDLVGEREAYEKALEMHRAGQTLKSPAGANLLRNIGIARMESATLAAAEEAFNEALELHKEFDSLHSQEGAKLMRNIGMLRALRHDTKEALRAFEQASSINVDVGAQHTPQHARLLGSLVESRSANGDKEGAIQAYQQALQIYEQTQTLDTQDAAQLFLKFGLLKSHSEDIAGALEAYDKAYSIYSRLGALDSPDCCNLLLCIGQAKGKLGMDQGEREAYEEAYVRRERSGSLRSAAGSELLGQMSTSCLKRGKSEKR